VLPEPTSDIQLSLIKKWLQFCDENHGCMSLHASTSRPSLPTRLIDVGIAGEASLRLVESYDQQNAKYCALSHCWGRLTDKEKFCTYQDNRQAFLSSISLDEMPRTFRDAVDITRALKVRYLWIDSVCIVQDDPEDWEAESERMEDVFSSAYVTIAASSSSSSLEGFLGPRRGRAPTDCVELRSQKAGSVYICKAIDNFRRDVETGALNKRGWVLQERVLSRRSIHFTSTQVYWECSEGVHCETLAKIRK
jgi:hypothetical protein